MAEQTILRIQTNKIKENFVSSGTFTYDSDTDYGLSVSGSGTTVSPYSFTTFRENPLIPAVGIGYFDITGGQGTVNFAIFGEDDKYSSISIIYQGNYEYTYVFKEEYGSFAGEIPVNSGDRIKISLNGDDVTAQIYYEDTPTPIYETIDLDLYTDIPIKINKSFSELQDISKKNSDYSIGLTLPGTKKNNIFFENYFDVDMSLVYFNPSKRSLCKVLVEEGKKFEGYLKLNKINIKNSQKEYDVTIYSSVADLFGQIGNNLLKDLDYGDPYHHFNHIFNLENVTKTWDRSNFSYFLDPIPYIYPIIHNGYAYSGDTVNFSGGTLDSQTRFYTSSSPIGSYDYPTDFTAAGGSLYRINSPGVYGLVDHQLKPALNVWHLTQLIFKNYGYTINSEFFKTPWFKALYMYGFYNNDSTKFAYDIEGYQTVYANAMDYVITDSTTHYTEDWCGSPYAYVDKTLYVNLVKKGSGVRVKAKTDVTVVLGFKFYPYLSNPYLASYWLYGTYAVTIPAGESVGTYTFRQQRWADYLGDPCTPGVQLLLYTGADNSSTIKESNAEIIDAEDDTTEVAVTEDTPIQFSSIIDEKLKQIDFLSSLAKKFDLVFYQDPDVPKQIIVEPYSYYVGTGEVYDWTDKLSYDEGFSVEPAFSSLESSLRFTDKEGKDAGNQEFKDRQNKIYGENIINNSTDFTSSEKKIETIFEPMVIRKWDADGTDNVELPLGMSYVTNTSEEDVGNYKQIYYKYEGVKTNPKLFFWLGSYSPFLDNPTEVYDYTKDYKTYTFNIRASDALYASEEQTIPIISHTMSMGNVNASDRLSILYNSEKPLYIDVDSYKTYAEDDIYKRFYQNRIDNLYDPDTRLLTGKFNLSLSDISNLKPNDLIKINNQYFTWNKIDGYNYTNEELTKCELIQYNYKVLEYPMRYFKYQYCGDSTVYKFKTNFTADQLYYSNVEFSMMYDYNIGIMNNQTSGTTTGFTSSFYSLSQDAYLPYYIWETTEDDYNDSGISFDYDGFLKGITGFSESILYAVLPSYWEGTTMTGLNVFADCDEFATAASTYGITTGSTPTMLPTPTATVEPTPTPTPTPPPTKGSLMINIKF